MDIKYVYVKTRSEFGKQCIFDICGPNLDEEIKPNPQEMRNFIVKSQCHVNTQYTKQIALHEIQTKAVKMKNNGMYHYEGGWPKEIHPRDDETIARYRRRVEKDDEWAPTLRYLLADMEHSILLNNAVNIHDHYFDDMIPTTLTTEREIRLVNVFPDQETPGRPVTDINWSPEETKIVVCYCFDNLRREIDYSMLTYIWDLASPNKPCMALNALYPTMVCQFNPRDPFILCGGLMNGQVCCWDVRKSIEPVQLSYPRNSHRYSTTSVKWIYTKTNTEFFSSSWDGQVLWWDMRNLRQPTERLIFDLEYPNEPSMERSIGISSANFEPSMSTKFMFGLQNGIVISGSRKVKTNAEKLSVRFDTHSGVVKSVDRNVFSPKIFLTVCKTSTRIWAEDTREGSLITIRSRGPIQACWNKTRHSLFYIIKENGQLEVYDILENLEKPIIELYLSDVSLTTMAAHENGHLLAIGDKNGNIFLTRSTDSLGKFDRNEKNNLTMGFDRNSRHVKAVDARLKEIRILRTLEIKEPSKEEKISKAKNKNKTRAKMTKNEAMTQKNKIKKGKKSMREEFPEILFAEDMFFETVEKEKQKFELDNDPELKYSTFVQKFNTKQLKVKEIDKTKDDSKEKMKVIKKKRLKVSKQMLLDMITEKEKIEQTISELLTETRVDEMVPTMRGLKKRKIKKRMRVKKFNLRLPRSCTIVCQPKVCCWRKTWLSRKYAPHMRKKLRDPTLTAYKTKKFFRHMLELPVEFDIELEKAKKEIHRAKKPTNWTRKKQLVELILLTQ
ncbi:dynein axonemal intermediate chain 2-like [Vespa crabro]|uniref:dynein axonemal intermediate chain 2-like n=1 Tax=Vespa crabro TaxID=7445 RepID=UPI001F004958|nr:dynein axonemal intermediate chain 2-like [Vespa crabro]